MPIFNEPQQANLTLDLGLLSTEAVKSDSRRSLPN